MNRLRHALRYWLAGVAAFLATTTAAQARVLYVDDDATAGGNGTSWLTAFDDLQDALAAAIPGDEIRVAGGTYRPAGPDADRDATFQLRSGVALYGGYAGTVAPNPDLRNPAHYQTTLSGDLNGNDNPADFPHGSTFAENSRHVVTANGAASTAIVDGFVITGGNGSSPGIAVGAGILNVTGSPTVHDCVITQNWGALGAGMYNEDDSSPTLTDCTFTVNVARYGGGALYNGGSSPVLKSCNFTLNTAEGVAPSDGGGGVVNAGDSNPEFTHCLFIENASTGSRGGAIFNHAGSDPVFENCHFEDNSAERDGGAMYNTRSNTVVVGCTFVGNLSNRFGGAVHNDRSSPSFSRCLFAGNTASGGGGVFVQAGSLPSLTDCAFTGNVATFDGGGMYTNDSAVLTNCTFAGNRTGPFGEGGGIVVLAGASPTLRSCILWNNSDGGGTDESGQIHVGDADPKVTYSCVQGLDTFAGSGNIGDDPRFVDLRGADGVVGTTDDDVRLRPDSPGINAGDPAFVAQPGAMDLDGHARVLCDRVDMGAYEFGIGDADCDRDVDLEDYLLWSLCMLGPAGGPYVPGCEVFDFDLDGHVDVSDFAGLQRIFGE